MEKVRRSLSEEAQHLTTSLGGWAVVGSGVASFATGGIAALRDPKERVAWLVSALFFSFVHGYLLTKQYNSLKRRELDIIALPAIATTMGGSPWRIRIKNKNTLEAAHNIVVKIISLENDAGKLPEIKDLPWTMDAPSDFNGSLNADDEEEYLLFYLSVRAGLGNLRDQFRVIQATTVVATNQPNSPLAPSHYSLTVAEFSSHKSYSIKIRVTSTNFGKKESDFVISFKDKGDKYELTMTPRKQNS